MYRILEANHPVKNRRNQRVHPQYAKRELVATVPNEVWSWDITRLLGPRTWNYCYLYGRSSGRLIPDGVRTRSASSSNRQHSLSATTYTWPKEDTDGGLHADGLIAAAHEDPSRLGPGSADCGWSEPPRAPRTRLLRKRRNELLPRASEFLGAELPAAGASAGFGILNSLVFIHASVIDSVSSFESPEGPARGLRRDV